jgi:hypothetical protein
MTRSWDSCSEVCHVGKKKSFNGALFLYFSLCKSKWPQPPTSEDSLGKSLDRSALQLPQVGRHHSQLQAYEKWRAYVGSTMSCSFVAQLQTLLCCSFSPSLAGLLGPPPSILIYSAVLYRPHANWAQRIPHPPLVPVGGALLLKRLGSHTSRRCTEWLARDAKRTISGRRLTHYSTEGQRCRVVAFTAVTKRRSLGTIFDGSSMRRLRVGVSEPWCAAIWCDLEPTGDVLLPNLIPRHTISSLPMSYI